MKKLSLSICAVPAAPKWLMLLLVLHIISMLLILTTLPPIILNLAKIRLPVLAAARLRLLVGNPVL